MNLDRVGDGEWSSTIYIDPTATDEAIYLYGTYDGLRIDVDTGVKLSTKTLRELRLALARYERWRG